MDERNAQDATPNRIVGIHGLVWAMADELRDGTPSDAAELRRHLEIVGALSRSLELYSAAMVCWIGKRVDECELER